MSALPKQRCHGEQIHDYVCGPIMNLLRMADSDIPALEKFMTITSS